MLVKEDELELHEEHLRVERGSGCRLREEEGAALYREVISPGW
jgi:hypothetical protein